MVEWFGKRARRGLGVTLALGLFLLPSLAWATTQVGDVELQAWYRQRHTFQTDSFDHVDWVQWRNEVFGWLVYDDIVRDGLLFDQIKVPFVQYATLNARYRFRYDPVYQIRDHFDNIYDDETKGRFIIPENGFRDIFVDLDFGQMGPGRLSARIGNQQLIWGEADLFRSLDAINPLQLNQTTGVGEKLDDLRFPLPIFKLLYDIGTVGQYLSEVTFEGFYTPAYRTSHVKLLVDNALHIPFHVKACWKDGKSVPYSVENCKDSRQFLPYRPNWLPWRRTRHPWSIIRHGSTNHADAYVFGCVPGTPCRSDVANERTSVFANHVKGNHHFDLRGWDQHAGGVRLLAKTFFNVDFTLNYLYIYNLVSSADSADLFRNKTWGDLRPELVYGDFGIIPDGNGGVLPPAGNFEEGLRRCLSRTGKAGDGGGRLQASPNRRDSTILTGADLHGFDWPERRLDANGNPLPGAQPHAARLPLTTCANGLVPQWGTNVFGLTATYNDFNYTGAVFRTEQSISTRETQLMFPPDSPNPRIIDGKPCLAGDPCYDKLTKRAFKTRLSKSTWVWRGMLAMDMLKAYDSYWLLRWTRYLPGQLGTNQSFVSAQWFWVYKAEANANGRHIGTGSLGLPGVEGERWYRWDYLLTLGTGGYGYFRGKLESRMAVVYEPRAQQTLLYGEWWWRNLLGYEPLEVSFGVSWKPSSRHDESWTALQFYTNRDLLWAQFTLYLL
jgi:hypothetical protein